MPLTLASCNRYRATSASSDASSDAASGVSDHWNSSSTSEASSTREIARFRWVWGLGVPPEDQPLESTKRCISAVSWARSIDSYHLGNESGSPSELGSRHGRCPAFPGLLELHLGPKRRGSDSDKGRLRRASRDYTGGEGECQKSQRNWAGCPMAPRSASFHLLGRQDHPGRPPTRTSGYAAGALRSETE